jgi:hypothetical protein
VGISAVRGVGICNLTRNNGTKVLFKAHLVNDHGSEASAHQRRLLNHPLGMITIRDKKRTEYTEAGQTSLLARRIPVRAVEEQGTLAFAKLAPGDAMFPMEGPITADAGIVLGEELGREYGTVGCFLSNMEDHEKSHDDHAKEPFTGMLG